MLGGSQELGTSTYYRPALNGSCLLAQLEDKTVPPVGTTQPLGIHVRKGSSML